jgi:PKD repeat protein
LTNTCDYLITYVNNSCQLTINFSKPINLTSDSYSVVNNTLTVLFELNESGEIYEYLQAETCYLHLDFEAPGEIILLVDYIPNPSLSAFANAPNIGIPKQPIQFNGSAIFGNPPYSYHWDFGDGKTSSEKDPIHTYNKPGIFRYTLTVTDDSGSIDNISRTIRILQPTFIIGKITNKTKTEDITTFDVINIRYVQYSPLSFSHFKDGEKINIYGKLIGIISKRFICGFFYSTVIYSYSRYNYSMNIFSRDDSKNTIIWLVSGVEGQLVETDNIETFLENESGYPQQGANITFNEVTGYGYVNPGDTFTVVAPSDGDYRFILYHKTQGYDLFISSLTHY